MADRDVNNLDDAVFAFIEIGGSKDPSGKTVPRSLRHFPLHDEPAVRTALTQAPQSPWGKQSAAAILAAARKYKIIVDGGMRAAFGVLDPSETGGWPERRFTRFPPEIRQADHQGPSHIFGYAAAFGKLSRKLGGFVEQVDPLCF